MKDAIIKALKSGISFAIYRYPGETDYHFIADLPGQTPLSPDTFIIKSWGDAPAVTVRDTITLADLRSLSLPKRQIAPPDIKPTDCDSYIEGLARVIDMLRREGGKVVISRTDVLADSNLTLERIVDAAFDIFDNSPRAFRYIFHTPSLGAWIGATPEILIDFDSADHSFHTMALAGTKYELRTTNYDKPSDIDEWDEKNLHEHQIVADFILDSLASVGIKAVADPIRTLNLGHISHLLTPIHGFASNLTASDIANLLHPTPAIAGFPRNRALSVIAAIEKHPRQCYAGYLMATHGTHTRAFANLRCFRFAEGICCFFGGGGIVADSDPQTEFNETLLKISTTKSHLL